MLKIQFIILIYVHKIATFELKSLFLWKIDKRKTKQSRVRNTCFVKTHQAGGEGGVWLAQVERTHANEVWDLRGRLQRCLHLLGVGGQQKVLPCTVAQRRSTVRHCWHFVFIAMWQTYNLTISFYNNSHGYDNQMRLWVKILHPS